MYLFTALDEKTLLHLKLLLNISTLRSVKATIRTIKIRRRTIALTTKRKYRAKLQKHSTVAYSNVNLYTIRVQLSLPLKCQNKTQTDLTVRYGCMIIMSKPL